MSAAQANGPSVANVIPSRNNKYYRISSLLDELDMLDPEERSEFTQFLKEFLAWDADKQEGYTREECAAMPDEDMECYAKRFLDEALIRPQNWKAGELYWPPRDLDMGVELSPHPKKWTYGQHRDGIIEVVTQIMIMQKRNINEGLRKSGCRPLDKTQKTGNGRRQQHNRQAPVSQRKLPCDVQSEDDSDYISSSNAKSNSTLRTSMSQPTRHRLNLPSKARSAASPSHENVEHAPSTNVSYQSTALASASSRQSFTAAGAELAELQQVTDSPPNTTNISRGNSSSSPRKRPISISDSNDDDYHHIRARTSTSVEDAMLSRSSNGAPNKDSFESWFQGIDHACTYLMKAYAQQQIAARRAKGVESARLAAKADAILDTLLGLEETLKKDKERLGGIVAGSGF